MTCVQDLGEKESENVAYIQDNSSQYTAIIPHRAIQITTKSHLFVYLFIYSFIHLFLNYYCYYYFDFIFFLNGCTSGGVYVPCIYTHAR